MIFNAIIEFKQLFEDKKYSFFLIDLRSVTFCLLGIISCYYLVKVFRLEHVKIEKRNKAKDLMQLLAKFEPEPLGRTVGCLRNPDTLVLNQMKCIDLVRMDYFSLLGSSELRSVAKRSIRTYGVGTCGPRSFYGTNMIHHNLENKIISLYGKEKALIYPSGIMTTSSVVACFVGNKEDLIFVDEFTSRDILLGIDCKKAIYKTFEHNDFDDFRNKLQYMEKSNELSNYIRRFLLLEGICSNTGTICSLKNFIAVARKFKFRIILDESYSFGILGKSGKGILEHAKVTINDVDIICGSFETCLSNMGGFSTTNAQITAAQMVFSVGFVYSASLPVFHAQTILETLNTLGEKPKMLKALSKEMHVNLKQLEPYLYIISDPESPRKVLKILSIRDVHILENIYAKIVHFCAKKHNVYLEGNRHGLYINIYLDLIQREKEKLKIYQALKEAAAKIIRRSLKA